MSVKSLTINDDVKEAKDQSIVLEYNVEKINVELVANDENAKVTYTVDGEAVEKVEDIAAPAIGGEAVVVTATITAQDEETTVTYTFTFTRKARSTSFAIAVNDANMGWVKYAVGDDEGESYGEYAQEVELGTVYELEAFANDGFNFKYWEVAGSVISEEKTITYTVNLNSTIKAVFAPTTADDAQYVTLKNRNGQVIANYTIGNSDTFAITEPTQTGYVFDSWLRNDGTVFAKDVLTTLSYGCDALKDAEGNLMADVTFTAQYKVSETTYTVNVTDGYIYAVGGKAVADQPTSGAYTYNTPIQVKPNNSAQFTHWIKDGKVASYSPEYTFYVTTAETTTLEAAYEVDEVEKPFINISNIVKDNGKLRFFTERHVPAGYTFIGAGLTVSKEQSGLGECEKLDASTTIFQWTSKNANAKQFTATKANVENYTWYAKAWLMYKDASGNIYTTYSTEENASLAN